MALNIIVSYDDTPTDHDALALGRLLATTGASLSLAYVRHTHEPERGREALQENEAQALLERGARWLERPNVPRHVVVAGSTGEGLRALAEREHAHLVVLASDYRTAPGSVRPGTSAQRLLAGGPAGVALAPAGMRDLPTPHIATVGVIPEGDAASEETARTLATALGATLASPAERHVDLLVVGSRPEAPDGRVMVSAATEYAIETASAPAIVVPRGVALHFGSPTSVAA